MDCKLSPRGHKESDMTEWPSLNRMSCEEIFISLFYKRTPLNNPFLQCLTNAWCSVNTHYGSLFMKLRETKYLKSYTIEQLQMKHSFKIFPNNFHIRLETVLKRKVQLLHQPHEYITHTAMSSLKINRPSPRHFIFSKGRYADSICNRLTVSHSLAGPCPDIWKSN